MSFGYVVRRLCLFLLVVWAAASLNFFVPRMARDRDPVREKLGQLAASGDLRQPLSDLAKMVGCEWIVRK